MTFWEEQGKTTRSATIRHLQDLKHRCQVLGLDCGFNATDLLLIYFCDQNSDACVRLFTPHIADLLDEHVPGSQGTSLYIRVVHHLIEPFRVPDFGSPKDVQRSVSCGITILRLWRKVLELKKMTLHSKPGAKNNPSACGRYFLLLQPFTSWLCSCILRNLDLFGLPPTIPAQRPPKESLEKCKGRQLNCSP